MRTRKSSKDIAAKPYRFHARLNESQRLLIQRAADLEGLSLKDFVLHSAESAAERTIQERAMVLLSARDTVTFVNMLLQPREPGNVLRTAKRRYEAHKPPGAAPGKRAGAVGRIPARSVPSVFSS